MWITRDFEQTIRAAGTHFPAIVLTGARQVGKSSLLNHIFPDYRYLSLDVPSLAERAETEPENLLQQYPPPIILDEVQYAPALFRYLKVLIDRNRHTMGHIVLTGSQKFPLMQNISESLAGRAAILELESLSASEIASTGLDSAQAWRLVVTRGGYPELWRNQNMPRDLFFQSYLATYLERDVRQVIHIGSLRDFERFIRACASRSGQLLNKSDLARDVGISPTTAGEWLSVLVASNQIFLLEPWFANVGKRLVKSPKLYLADSGFLCFLLGIGSADLDTTPYRGAVWETFIYSELRKANAKRTPAQTIHYYRDQQNREVDFLLEKAGRISLFDAKLSEQPDPRDAEVLRSVANILQGRKPHPSIIADIGFIARPQHEYSKDGLVINHGMRVNSLRAFNMASE